MSAWQVAGLTLLIIVGMLTTVLVIAAIVVMVFPHDDP